MFVTCQFRKKVFALGSLIRKTEFPIDIFLFYWTPGVDTHNMGLETINLQKYNPMPFSLFISKNNNINKVEKLEKEKFYVSLIKTKN